MSYLPDKDLVRSPPFNWSNVADTLSLERLDTQEKDISFYVGKATLGGVQNGSELRVNVKQARQLYDTGGAYYNASAHVVARYTCGAGPRLKLLREGTFRCWLKQFGYEDIEVGNRTLDFNLTIKGEPKKLVRILLSTNAGLLVDYIKERYGTLPQSDGVTIEAETSFLSTNPEKAINQIKSLVQLLSLLASTDFAGLDALRKLPGAKESRADDMPIVTIEVPTQVDFVPVYDGEIFRSRARTQLQRKLQPFDLRCKHVANVEKAGEMRDLASALRLFPDARIVATENELSLTWPTVISDTDVLLAGATLLAQMASPKGQNAYR